MYAFALKAAGLIVSSLIALAVAMPEAIAQDRDPAALPLSIRPPRKPRPFTLGFQETYYLADKSTLLGAKHFEEVGLRVRGQGNSEFLSAGIDAGASFAINIPDYFSIFVPEAYFKFVLSEASGSSSPVVTFGRKKDRWSLLDSFWELGAWQPQYRWDYLRPEEQGLIGAFLEVPRESFRFLLFASPIFVPESGPSYKLQNNKLVSNNPWFFEPSEQLKIINVATDVRYDLKIPPIEEIVLQGAAGASLEVGARSAGLWSRASYVYKPRNQLSLPFSGELIAGPNYVEALIFPRTQYHHLAALDVGYKSETYSVWLANLYDQPVDETYDSKLTYQQISPNFLISPGIEYSHTIRNGISMGVVASYLYTEGEEAVDAGRNTQPGNPVFAPVFNFTNAARGTVRFSMPSGPNDLRATTAISLTQSLKDDSSWLKLQGEWMFSQKLRANLEGDFIGSYAPRSNNQFLSRYRGNDRIIAGASLLF